MWEKEKQQKKKKNYFPKCLKGRRGGQSRGKGKGKTVY